MRQTDRKLIRALPLFRDMSEENFAELVNAAFLQRFPQHTTLITEGDLPDFLHIVVDGSVEMFSVHNGHETTIDIMRPVTTFILAAVIRDAVYLKSARALSPAQILMIPAQTVRDVFDRDAAFARAIVNELAERYRSIVRALKNEKLRTSAERLANWILRDQCHAGLWPQHRIDLRQAYAGLAPRHDSGEFVAQFGATDKIRREELRPRHRYRGSAGTAEICQAERAD